MYNSHNCVQSVRALGNSRASLQGVKAIGMELQRVLWDLGYVWDLEVSLQSSRSPLVLTPHSL